MSSSDTRADAFEYIVVATVTLAVAVMVTLTGTVIQTEVTMAMALRLMATEVEGLTEVGMVEGPEVTRCLISELASRRKNGVRSLQLPLFSSISNM